MKKRLLLCSSLIFAGVVSAQQMTPTCNMGTAFAVNPNRQMAPGEEITNKTGGVVVVAQRETPGSTHIVFRRCTLPRGEEVVIGGTIPWVKKCGNALVQTEGWTLPLVAASQKPVVAPAPEPKPQVEVQKEVEKTKEGDVNVNVNVNIHNPPPPPTPPAVAPPPKKKSKKWVAILVGAGAAGGTIAAILLTRSSPHKNAAYAAGSVSSGGRLP